MPYVGRFAPSPTGALHEGSIVAALGSWLDARAAGGQWLLRIEDVDTPRCSLQAAHEILRQLEALQLHADGPVLWQSQRSPHYESALQQLLQSDAAYPCACSRREIEEQLEAAGRTIERHAQPVYPGTCRHSLRGRAPRSVRFRVPEGADAASVPLGASPGCRVNWVDRRLGAQSQNVSREVGDFVLQRADGLWAYQLAVVVDDAAQGVSEVVRGEDLADNTARQILLQRALGLPTPRYLHLPLVLGNDGSKLSKQNGAIPVRTDAPVEVLQRAASVLGLVHAASLPAGRSLGDWLQQAVSEWKAGMMWVSHRKTEPGT